VVPFETKLIRDGRKAARATGLEFLQVPMLPWISENGEALARIEEIVARGEGRYYVHCYLGKDRIRVVKNFVSRLDPDARIEVSRELERHEARRRLEDGTVWERGGVVLAGPDLFLTPQPAPDEYVSFILPGQHGPVVSLLDPQNELDRPWIEEERRILESNGVPFTLLPVPVDPYDPERALAAARAVRSMERPLIVHAMLGPLSGRSPAAESFLQALRSDLPPLPPSLFIEPMQGGGAAVVAPNVAVGPRPAPTEFGAYLHRRGVREVVHVAGPPAPEIERDGAMCSAAGLSWRGATPGDELLRLVRRGGPWYLYGPGLGEVRSLLERALGPPLPELQAPDPPRIPLPDAERPFLERLLPGPRLVVVLGPVLALVASLAALFVARLGTEAGIATPYTRKIFHFLIFTLAGVLHLAGGLAAVALFGGVVSAVVLYGVLRGDGFGFYEALARPTDAPRRTLFVLVPLGTTALGGLTANLLFGSVAYVGYLVAGWGDAIAEPVGRAWGRHRYRVPSLAGVPAQRSLEGSAAVLLVGGLAAFLALWWGGIPPVPALGTALACGVAGAGVEAVSNHGLDNFTVQVAVTATVYFI
jgi:phytol kinase